MSSIASDGGGSLQQSGGISQVFYCTDSPRKPRKSRVEMMRRRLPLRKSGEVGMLKSEVFGSYISSECVTDNLESKCLSANFLCTFLHFSLVHSIGRWYLHRIEPGCKPDVSSPKLGRY